MSNSTIGLKIADGTYYPILSEEAGIHKRLILTTVKDKQRNVQIDLYKGAGEKIEDATYVGSLVIENINEGPKGEPEIELIVGLDDDCILNAEACDLSSGEKQSLSVSLANLESEAMYDVPDFDLDEEVDYTGHISPEEATRLTKAETEEQEEFEPESDAEAAVEEEYTGRSAPSPLKILLFVIFGLALIAAITIGLISLFKSGDTVPQLQGNADSVQEAPPVIQPGPSVPQPVDAVSASGEKKTPDLETAAAAATSAEPQEPAVKTPAGNDTGPTAAIAEEKGVWYLIRRGDTLWDLSYSFYKNPYLYPRIAERNNIPNPRLIITGKKLFIPMGE